MIILMGTIRSDLYLIRTPRSILVITPKRLLITKHIDVFKQSNFTKNDIYEFLSAYYDRKTVYIESFYDE